MPITSMRNGWLVEPIYRPNLTTLGPLPDISLHPWNFAWILMKLGKDLTGLTYWMAVLDPEPCLE